MRTPEQWADGLDPMPTREEFLAQVRAIQSDASRSAARSERERAARVCERMCQQASDIGCASRYQHVREGQAMLATAFREVADYLRDMPDAKSTDGDAGEGA